jgi:hypothetical protein
VGYTPTHIIHNDPFGEADLAKWRLREQQRRRRYRIFARRNWLPRWLIEGNDTGWFMSSPQRLTMRPIEHSTESSASTRPPKTSGWWNFSTNRTIAASLKPP